MKPDLFGKVTEIYYFNLFLVNIIIANEPAERICETGKAAENSATRRIVICRKILDRASKSSVLTRILPWGVAGPPLLKNRGPVRILDRQSYSKRSVT